MIVTLFDPQKGQRLPWLAVPAAALAGGVALTGGTQPNPQFLHVAIRAIVRLQKNKCVQYAGGVLDAFMQEENCHHSKNICTIAHLQAVVKGQFWRAATNSISARTLIELT